MDAHPWTPFNGNLAHPTRIAVFEILLTFKPSKRKSRVMRALININYFRAILGSLVLRLFAPPPLLPYNTASRLGFKKSYCCFEPVPTHLVCFSCCLQVLAPGVYFPEHQVNSTPFGMALLCIARRYYQRNTTGGNNRFEPAYRHISFLINTKNMFVNGLCPRTSSSRSEVSC